MPVLCRPGGCLRRLRKPEKAAGGCGLQVILDVGEDLYHGYPVIDIVPTAKQGPENLLHDLRA